MNRHDFQSGELLGGANEVRCALLPDGRWAIAKRAAAHEARVTAELEHPNIRGLLGGAGDAGEYELFEFVEGVSLYELSRRTKLSIDASVYIVRQVLCALDLVHRKYNHRDMSPHNVLIRWDGAVKLADFELARMHESPVTKTAMVRGTPCYLSPEQFQGSPLDARSDLFALGVVLYELLTGRKPYGETRHELMSRLYGVEPFTPITELRPELSENPRLSDQLNTAIAAMLERDAEKRCPSALDALELLPAVPQGYAGLLESLDEVQATMQAAEPQQGVKTAGPRNNRRWRFLRFMGAFAGDTCAIVAVAWLWWPTSTILPHVQESGSDQQITERALDGELCMPEPLAAATTVKVPTADSQAPPKSEIQVQDAAAAAKRKPESEPTAGARNAGKVLSVGDQTGSISMMPDGQRGTLLRADKRPEPAAIGFSISPPWEGGISITPERVDQ